MVSLSQIIKHPQAITMVWSCMAANGLDRLELVSGMMNGTKYTDVLENKTLPRARFLLRRLDFQDNNAPCHSAKKVQQ